MKFESQDEIAVFIPMGEEDIKVESSMKEVNKALISRGYIAKDIHEKAVSQRDAIMDAFVDLLGKSGLELTDDLKELREDYKGLL